ncbi:hypothetical protein [Paenibacillus campinasensis]|uniref:Uncharacterized protein n=1 Tax=Paenibacillus campinasensis TaxID=66347 RepID=A0A268EI72_9BACL|nr:hypothetical protein [Paenibacillus campinasensis]PAD72815.1 hypothetical protein CHH67_21135 [Paenibacillus campinasensis]
MADVREYWERLSVTASELNDIVSAQQVAVDAFDRKASQDWIRRQLEAINSYATTFLALAFARSTPVGVATGIAIIIAGPLADNYFLNAIRNGLHGRDQGTLRHSTWFNNNTDKYQRIEFEAAFVEYTDAGGRIRFITGAGPIDRMQRRDGTWVYAS